MRENDAVRVKIRQALRDEERGLSAVLIKERTGLPLEPCAIGMLCFWDIKIERKDNSRWGLKEEKTKEVILHAR